MNRPRTVLDDILERGSFSPVTRRQYENVIGAWLEFAGHDPRNWTRLTAQRFYDAKRATGIRVKSANSYIENLRYVSKWYADVYGGENFAMIQLPIAPDQTKPRRALAPGEVQALLATCEGELAIAKRPIDRRDRTMLIVGLETGMRAMSLSGARLEKIVMRGAYPYITVPVKGKAGLATFEVPLSDTALLAIEDWRGWLRAQDIKDGALFPALKPRLDAKGHRAYEILIGENGISPVRIYQIVSERAAAAGIAHAHPHLMRHTFVTWRLEAGLTAPAIASITAHKLSRQGEHSNLAGNDWGGIAPYVNLKSLSETARQSTPPWFADHVRKLIGG